MRRSNGCRGSTKRDCLSRSGISRRWKLRQTTTNHWVSRLKPPDSNKTASAIPGAIQLFALLLQATFPGPVQEETDGHEMWRSNSFCIRCGQAHQSGGIKQHYTQRGKMYWTLTCNECGMQSTRTHCFGCNSSILFKNGLQLTYHRTVADQVTNIVCPQCGEYFDNDLHDRRNGSHMQESEAYEDWAAGL